MKPTQDPTRFSASHGSRGASHFSLPFCLSSFMDGGYLSPWPCLLPHALLLALVRLSGDSRCKMSEVAMWTFQYQYISSPRSLKMLLSFFKNKLLELHVWAVSTSLPPPLPIKLLPRAPPSQIHDLFFNYCCWTHAHTYAHTCIQPTESFNVGLMRMCLGLTSWITYSGACPRGKLRSLSAVINHLELLSGAPPCGVSSAHADMSPGVYPGF